MEEFKISKKLTANAKKCLRESQELAFNCGLSEIEPEHLLMAIFLEDGSLGSTLLKKFGIKQENLNFIIIGCKKVFSSRKKPVCFSSELKTVLTKAYSFAKDLGYPYVGTEHLVYALMESKNKIVVDLMKKTKMTLSLDENYLPGDNENNLFADLPKIFGLNEATIFSKKTDGPLATPYLEQFCQDVNADALKRNEIIVGREAEIKRIINILGRKNKNNPLLLGDPGVGKTAIVFGLAQKINNGEVPPSIAQKKVLSLDLAAVIAGTSFRGEFEMRLKELIKEIRRHKEVILFIDEMHTIMGAGNTSGGLDAANILKPALADGSMHCIGATTFPEYKKHIERDPALERRFQPVRIHEPSLGEAKEILRGVKQNYEKFHRISISACAVNAAVELGARYITERFLPDKAFDIIDEAASSLRNKEGTGKAQKEIASARIELAKIKEFKNGLVEQENYEEAGKIRENQKVLENKIKFLGEKNVAEDKAHRATITAKEISETVSQMTGIPVEKISFSGKNVRISRLKKNLSSQIIGQDKIIEKINSVLLRSYSGISSPHRPIGSFLFLGPTGVGKTLTAKVLAQEIFGSRESLIRIDMSEFMEKHNLSRLIGAPAGYVGYEEGGKLTEKIRHQPFSVILFDEIEKAHPDMHNILLQILEDGTLTDAEGRTANFKNSILVLTSNLGTDRFTRASAIGFGADQDKTADFNSIKKDVLSELKKSMKPELINRLDHILIFDPLGKKEVRKIIRLELEKLKNRIRENKIGISFNSEVIDHLAQESFSPEQGARLIRKKIEELVENAVAETIMKNAMKKNSICVAIDSGIVKAS